MLRMDDLKCSACIDPKRSKLSIGWTDSSGKYMQHLNLFDLGDKISTRIGIKITFEINHF